MLLIQFHTYCLQLVLLCIFLDVVVVGYNQGQNSNIKIGETKVRINTDSFPGKTLIFISTQLYIHTV